MKLFFKFLISAALSFLFISCINSTVYAVENGSFEQSNDRWTGTVSTVQIVISSSEFKESTHSAQITYSSSSSQGMKQTVSNIKSETTYTISGYIKSTPGTKKAFMRIGWYQQGSTSQVKTDDSEIIAPASDWTHVVFTSQSPANSSQAEIRLLVSEGSAFFDDIQMNESAIPTMTLEPTATPTPTTTQEPETPTPTPTQPETISHIFINEVMVYPNVGEPEWVELYNGNNFEVRIIDWYIDDTADSGSSPKKFSTTIPPFGYATLDVTSSMFNNSGDSVRLLNTDFDVEDTIQYDDSEKNTSFGKTSPVDDSVCFQEPTKGINNKPCLNLVSMTVTATPTKKPTITPTKKPIPTITVSPTRAATPFVKKYEHTITPKSKLFSSPTEKPEVLGLSDQNKSTIPINKKYLSLLAASYSLLSMLSISVKMIFAH